MYYGTQRRRVVRRPRPAPEGFRYVVATAEEIQQWRETHGGNYPTRMVRRVQCQSCEQRMWGSGLGIGSHRRSCSGVTA